MGVEFKNMVFAHDPNLYYELFEKIEVDESDLDWVIPQTEADVDYMMNQLRQAGVLG